MTQSKNYQKIKEKLNPQKEYSLEEAISLIKENKTRGFDESLEIHLKLGINLKKTEQKVKGSVVLPHAEFIKSRIVAFVEPEKEKEAKEAGADIVGGKELVDSIKASNKTDFDVAVATPAMMKEMVSLARILGPKGLMPSPKNGTITNNLKEAIGQLKKGKISFKNDDGGNIHQIVGKLSWDDQKVISNVKHFVEVVKKSKPSKFKGIFIKKITLCSTMGPGIKLRTSI